MLPFTYGGRGSGANSRTYFRTRIAAGGSHSLFVQAGLVWAWGKNDKGQLGDVSQTDRKTPSFVMGLNNIKAVSAGKNHSLALQTNGLVWAWGDNGEGQLGGSTLSFSSKPLLVKTLASEASANSIYEKTDFLKNKSFRRNLKGTWTGAETIKKTVPLENIIAIAAGGEHNLALDASGQIWAWGNNKKGQLGVGHQKSLSLATKVQNHTARQHDFLQYVIAIAAGENHSLAATSDGKTFCWGGGEQGQLGLPTLSFSPLPIQVKDAQDHFLESVVCVDAGKFYSIALTSTGKVFIWGNEPIQIGSSSTVREIMYSWDSYPIDISAGSSHSLVLTRKGKVYAWGQNNDGEVGNGKSELEVKKPAVTLIEDVLAIAAGASHSLSIKIDSSLWAWGNNAQGQLGTFPPQERELQPKRVLQKTQNLLATGSNHSLVIKGGTVWSWGEEGNKLGYRGSTSASTDVPTRIHQAAVTRTKRELQDVVAIAAGSNHSLALQVDGHLLAWGKFTFGQMRPAISPGTEANFIEIAAGHNHSIALKTDGTVWDWSRNTTKAGAIQYGQPISGLPQIISISANAGYSLALASDGTVWSWGIGYLGDGQTFQRRWTPKQVLIRRNPLTSEEVALKNIVSFSAGPLHSMAIDKNGEIWTWGNDGSGALGRKGNPLFAGKLAPSFGRTVRVAAGLRHSLALLDDGSVWVWGTNAQGQFGNGKVQKTPIRKPEKISELQSVIAISTNNKHNLTLHSNKEVLSWGEDLVGELGRPLQKTNHLNPGSVLNCSIAISISTNQRNEFKSFFIALKENGKISSWGENDQGQLGNGRKSRESNKPSQVLISPQNPLKNVISISAGINNCLAITLDGNLFVWGNKGQQNWLTFGKKIDTSYATKAIPTSGDTKNVIEATIKGQNRIQLLKENGTVWGWGHNYQGALTAHGCGTGDAPCQKGGVILFIETTTYDSKKPLKNIVALISGTGGNTNVAITSKGTAYQWGDLQKSGAEGGWLLGAKRIIDNNKLENIIGGAGVYSNPFVLFSNGFENFIANQNNILSIKGTSKQLVAIDAQGRFLSKSLYGIYSQSTRNSNVLSFDCGFYYLAALTSNGYVYRGDPSSINNELQFVLQP